MNNLVRYLAWRTWRCTRDHDCLLDGADRLLVRWLSRVSCHRLISRIRAA